MKYIVLEQDLGEGLKREVPIVFPNCLTHSLVAQAMVKSEELTGARPIAAGFIDMDANVCFGESESLKLKSRDIKDRLLLDTHDFLHGLV
jgi:hypothetical protein